MSPNKTHAHTKEKIRDKNVRQRRLLLKCVALLSFQQVFSANTVVAYQSRIPPSARNKFSPIFHSLIKYNVKYEVLSDKVTNQWNLVPVSIFQKVAKCHTENEITVEVLPPPRFNGLHAIPNKDYSPLIQTHSTTFFPPNIIALRRSHESTRGKQISVGLLTNRKEEPLSSV
jgi:hypothetical protein